MASKIEKMVAEIEPRLKDYLEKHLDGVRLLPRGFLGVVADHVAAAAEALKLTAQNLLSFGFIDEIIPEPPGGAHDRFRPQYTMARSWRQSLADLVNGRHHSHGGGPVKRKC